MISTGPIPEKKRTEYLQKKKKKNLSLKVIPRFKFTIQLYTPDSHIHMWPFQKHRH